MDLNNNEFFGKEGVAKWWIGQVPLGQDVNKKNASGWGDRVQVRILGSDPASGTQLHDRDLRWAMVLRPGSHGTLNRGSTGIIGGKSIGFFDKKGRLIAVIKITTICKTEDAIKLLFTIKLPFLIWLRN